MKAYGAEFLGTFWLVLGGWAVEQLGLFWVAPIVGAVLGAVAYKFVSSEE